MKTILFMSQLLEKSSHLKLSGETESYVLKE